MLEVRLMLNPELNEEVTVRPDGHISTTVVHDEVAYGRTVPELTAALAQRLLRRPAAIRAFRSSSNPSRRPASMSAARWPIPANSSPSVRR